MSPLKRRALAIASLLLLLASTACTTLKEASIPSSPAVLDYDRLYPYYVEVCALSQIKPLKGFKGGSAGHAVIYLKGVCRQGDSPYPRLRMCAEPSSDIHDPETGVGVSVDKMFKNVNWMVVPGKDLFFHGLLPADRTLDRDHFETVIEEAVGLGLFRGVELHASYLEDKPPDLPMEEYIARETAGTDYALKFGRSIFCVKLPVTPPMLERMVAFLNDLNEEYAMGTADYEWSGYQDNCTHTIHNALASAGVWKSKSVRTLKFLQIFNMALPANEFANLALLANEQSLENFRLVHKDEVRRRGLLEQGWLPMRHGALMSTIGVHRKNDLFDPEFTILVLQPTFLKYKSRRIREMYYLPRCMEIEDNLLYFRDRYERILEGRSVGLTGPEGDRSFLHDAGAFYRYVEDQLRDVEEKLNILYVNENGTDSR